MKDAGVIPWFARDPKAPLSALAGLPLLPRAIAPPRSGDPASGGVGLGIIQVMKEAGPRPEPAWAAFAAVAPTALAFLAQWFVARLDGRRNPFRE